MWRHMIDFLTEIVRINFITRCSFVSVTDFVTKHCLYKYIFVHYVVMLPV